MRTFIFVLSLGIVAIYNIGGAVGVGAWMLCLAAWAVGCGWGWYQTLATNTVNDNDGTGDDSDNTDLINADTDGNSQPLLLALVALIDPCTTENGAVLYSVCSSPYGRCTTSPAEDNGMEVKEEPKFLPIRRNRMSHHGEADRRASRRKADNSWKTHRQNQWR